MIEPRGGDLRDLCRFDSRFRLTEPVPDKADAALIFKPRSGERQVVLYAWEHKDYFLDQLADHIESSTAIASGICYALEEDRYEWDVYRPANRSVDEYRVAIRKNGAMIAGAQHPYSGYALLMAYVHMLHPSV